MIICKLILLLFFYSCLGWLMEVTLKYIEFHRFINRGYLIGPYCPIYGCGVVAMTVLVEEALRGRGSFGDVFLAGMIVCGALEYFVSWLMEKLFHARWWDYSKKPMNLHGRIWIGNIILFGLGSVIVIKFVNPVLMKELNVWSNGMLIGSSVSIACLLIADNILSGKMMNVVKREIDATDISVMDNTDEISSKIREILLSKNILLRRISSAYPTLKIRPLNLTKQLKKARQEVKAATKKVKAELRLEADIQKEKVRNAGIITATEIEYRIAKAKEELEKAKDVLQEIEKRIK